MFFQRDLPATYNMRQLKAPEDAIRDLSTFRARWVVLGLLLVGFFGLEPLQVPVGHNAPVFSPSAELRNALKEWSLAVDALHESQAHSRLEGDVNVAA